MSKGDRICFDASIQDDIIGIGIYHDNKKIKLHKAHNISLKPGESYKAEFIGLVTAMEYVYANEIINPLLFTDNETLATNGIPDYLIEKYGKARLHWIPREFNKIADKLSKISKKTSNNIKNLKCSKITREYLGAFDKDKKLKLLNMLATNEFRKIVLSDADTCSTQEWKAIKNMYRSSDYTFVMMCVMFNIFKNTNRTKLLRESFKRKKDLSIDSINYELDKLTNRVDN